MITTYAYSSRLKVLLFILLSSSSCYGYYLPNTNCLINIRKTSRVYLSDKASDSNDDERYKKEAEKSKTRLDRVMRWEHMFGLLVRFKEREGNCTVPYNHKEEEENLGAWLYVQRELYKKHTLVAARQQKLDKIGVFEPLENTNKWDQMYNLLKKFQEREGHCNVPRPHQEEGKKLGNWINTQRYNRKRDKLSKKRQSDLEKIGFLWEKNTENWERMYKLLSNVKERDGKCDVIALDYTEAGENLGAWLGTQRSLQKKGELDKDRARRLEKLGIRWMPYNNSLTVRWEYMCNLLAKFSEREGHCDVRQNHKEEGIALGRWLTAQRARKLKGTLGESRTAKLNEIGVAWTSEDKENAKWENMYEKLVEYQRREGHCNALQTGDSRMLGIWVRKQRQLRKKKSLSKECERKLDEIGMEWDPYFKRYVQWDTMYSRLAQFQEREGHCNVHRSHIEEGERLGQWLSVQRYLKNAGELREIRQQKLEEIGVKWDDLGGKRQQQWEVMYQSLLKFQEREGHCNVSYSHVEGDMKIGSWLCRQVYAKNDGKLSELRERKLDKIGVVWRTKRKKVKT
mmetsp:Transcript_4620/g.6670  ORF Transcript_4620/g.6670 Transcript_4620/m.6670 type:complete len:569 (+) Transcript_4620:76-1782(+)